MEEIPRKNGKKKRLKAKVRILISFFYFQKNKRQKQSMQAFYKIGVLQTSCS